jgi:hypothetical protein
MRAIALSLLLAGCAAQTQQGAISWTRSQVAGLHMSLKDAGGAVEGYSFARDGTVAATLGGPDMLTSPLYAWRIRDGRLQILDGAIVTEEFTLLRIDASALTAQRKSGRTAQFEYTRPK